jgi:hypothetical protein
VGREPLLRCSRGQVMRLRAQPLHSLCCFTRPPCLASACMEAA